MTLMWTLLLFFACQTPTPPADDPVHSPAVPDDPTVASLRSKPLELTFHGRCRMECRKIDREEVAAILNRDGTRVPERTRLDGECPTHALEGRTRDGQNVRLVFAECPTETRLVTAIDLDTDWPCGDC